MIQFRKKSSGLKDHLCIVFRFSSESDDYEVSGIIPTKQVIRYCGDQVFFQLPEDEAVLLEEEIVAYTWGRLLKFLTYRERSTEECKIYLKQMPTSETICSILIDRAKAYRYLDDKRFAELLTVSMISRKKSWNEIRHALTLKGISVETVSETLTTHYKEESRGEVIRYQFEKGVSKYPDRNSYQDYQKCISYLMRKGFSYSDFQEMIKGYYHSNDDTF